MFLNNAPGDGDSVEAAFQALMETTALVNSRTLYCIEKFLLWSSEEQRFRGQESFCQKGVENVAIGTSQGHEA